VFVESGLFFALVIFFIYNVGKIVRQG